MIFAGRLGISVHVTCFFFSLSKSNNSLAKIFFFCWNPMEESERRGSENGACQIAMDEERMQNRYNRNHSSLKKNIKFQHKIINIGRKRFGLVSFCARTVLRGTFGVYHSQHFATGVTLSWWCSAGEHYLLDPNSPCTFLLVFQSVRVRHFELSLKIIFQLAVVC